MSKKSFTSTGPVANKFESTDILKTPNFRKPCAQRLHREQEDTIIADVRLRHVHYFGVDGTDIKPNASANLAFAGEPVESKLAIASASAKYAEYYTHFLLNTGEGFNRAGLLASRNEFIEKSAAMIGAHSTRIILNATEGCVSDAFEAVLGMGR